MGDDGSFEHFFNTLTLTLMLFYVCMQFKFNSTTHGGQWQWQRQRFVVHVSFRPIVMDAAVVVSSQLAAVFFYTFQVFASLITQVDE